MKQYYLLNTITSWEETPRSRHQIAKALSDKGFTVFFIAKAKIGKPDIFFSEINDNIIIIQPFWPINQFLRLRTPILNELYQYWLFKKINEYFKINSINKINVINFDYTAHLIFRFFQNVIYYCNDEHIEFTFSKLFFIPYFVFSENKIIKNSKAVIVVSKYLLENKKSSHTYLKYTASDVFNYDADLKTNKQSAGKSIGYMGFINKKRINIEYIKALCVDFPDYTVKLIGPYDKSVKNIFAEYNNVLLLGKLTGSELCSEMKNIDVFIIPFKNNRINKPISAHNKLWQYLFFGKPIVSSYLPYLINLKRYFLYVSNDYKSFKDNIILALKENNDEYCRERHEFAKINSWNNRIMEIIKYFD